MSFGVFNFFLFLALLPCGKLFLRFVLGNPTRFLNFASQVIAFACNHIQLVIGKFAPLLLGVAFELFSVSFDTIPVCFCLLVVS